MLLVGYQTQIAHYIPILYTASKEIYMKQDGKDGDRAGQSYGTRVAASGFLLLVVA